MDAIDLLKRYLDQPIRDGAHFDEAERIPLERVVPEQWRKAVVDERGMVERIPYELCVLVSLRDALRRREIWVVGASRWRNPEDDLPPDFEGNRDVHYNAIKKPLDATAFTDALEKKLRDALARLDTALELGTTGGVEVTTRRGEPWIRISPLGRQEEPENLVALKAEIEHRWGTIDLLDILKESEFATGFTGEFASVATREVTSTEVLCCRLLLVLFALGTNMGIKRVVATGKHSESEAVLRRTRHLFVNRANLRSALVKLVNATFTVRDEQWWGAGTACASDSKKFGSWSTNFMTEWHQRYRGPGVMIYWYGTQVGLCLQPAEVLFGLRGRGHDRGCTAALQRHGDRPPLHRHPRCLDRRVRLRPHARLQPVAEAEERRLRPAVPAGDRGGPPVAQQGADRPVAPGRRGRAGSRAAGEPGRAGSEAARPDDRIPGSDRGLPQVRGRDRPPGAADARTPLVRGRA
ncbi:hypothetical protein SGFS_002530 [Streptomyces graminofaciens]|uniref:Tn3 transposase DDE domain-containing protein n=1 Tax=Streptomyces graminofaciens TaxID=68212 RepID=A0ABN5V6J6_9ACTN|nr:hypothetical protein SGFS_002530 [Streptomyces graminofaciens]